MKVSNINSGSLIKKLVPFNGSNLNGVKVSDDVYAVYSYGYWPIAVNIKGKWAYNGDYYSVTTNRHQYHVREALGDYTLSDIYQLMALLSDPSDLDILNDLKGN